MSCRVLAQQRDGMDMSRGNLCADEYAGHEEYPLLYKWLAPERTIQSQVKGSAESQECDHFKVNGKREKIRLFPRTRERNA